MMGPPEGVLRPERAFSLVEEESMVFCLRGVCDDDWELDGPVVPRVKTKLIISMYLVERNIVSSNQINITQLHILKEFGNSSI